LTSAEHRRDIDVRHVVMGTAMVAAVRLPAVVRRSHRSIQGRDAACEVVMKGVMAARLVALL
jgi:hypothetical protein